ncbi:MAG: alpha/beta hydrolase, partial [Pelagibacteraceae bacterium]
MLIDVQNKKTFYTSSGREIDLNQPTIIFVHGSGLTHVTWVLQTRYFAFHGYNTIAIDLPGHGYSDGPPLKTIEEMADWVSELIDVLGVKKASYIGHSQGCLIGLEFAHRHPEKLHLLALINGSLSMKMNPELLSLAQNKDQKAGDLMMDWVHGPLGQIGGH